MKRFFVILLLLFIGLLYAKQVTTVRCTGRGENRQQALEAAFQEAIRQAVGTFISSHSKASNNVVFEEILMNTNGMIQRYKEISCKTELGLISLEIEADVETGTLVENIESNSKLTAVEINNLLNRKNAILNARKTIENLLSTERYSLVTGEKIGSLKEISHTLSRKDQTLFGLDYKLKFNNRNYKALEEKLFSLLCLFAMNKIEGSTYQLSDIIPEDTTKETYGLCAVEAACSETVIRKYTNSSFYSLFSNSLISYFTKKAWYEYSFLRETHRCLVSVFRFFETCWNFCTRKKYGVFPEDVGIVVFCNADKVWYSKTPCYSYRLLVVPKLIFDKVEEELADTQAVLVHEFIRSGDFQPLTSFSAVKCAFTKISTIKNKKVIFLKNSMDLSIDGSLRNITEYNGAGQFCIRDRDLKNIQDYRCRIAMGTDAKFLTACYISPSVKKMRKLAERGSLRAMMAMATQFNKWKWLHSAALCGSAQAQKMLKWENAGLGFDLMRAPNGSYTVCMAACDLKIAPGDILLKINGKNVAKLSPVELSNMIGSFSTKDKLSVEFSNQKIIKVSPLPKAQTTFDGSSIIQVKN